MACVQSVHLEWLIDYKNQFNMWRPYSSRFSFRARPNKLLKNAATARRLRVNAAISNYHTISRRFCIVGASEEVPGSIPGRCNLGYDFSTLVLD